MTSLDCFAWYEAMTIVNITSGFKVTAVCSFDRMRSNSLVKALPPSAHRPFKTYSILDV